MAKRTCIDVNGEDMTVKEYAEMLSGQLDDAVNRIYEFEGNWSNPAAIEAAALALPDPCAFDIEVEDALKAGCISSRSWKMLYNVAKTQWDGFRAELTSRGLDASEYDDFQ